MLTRGVSIVYLLSTFIVWLELHYLTTEYQNRVINYALLILSIGGVIGQEINHTNRKYATVSRPLASTGLVDGVILVPLLFASLQPYLKDARILTRFNWSTYSDLFWISLLASLHFLLCTTLSNRKINPPINPKTNPTNNLTYYSTSSSSSPSSSSLPTIFSPPILLICLDIVAIFLIYVISGTSYVTLGVTLMLFTMLHHTLLSQVQKSFTLGEAAILSIAITQLTYISYHLSLRNTSTDTLSHHSVVLLALILGSVLICFTVFPILYNSTKAPRIKTRLQTIFFYATVLFDIFCLVAPWVMFITDSYPVSWIWKYMTSNLSNLTLVIYWVLCLFFLLPVIGKMQQYGVKKIIIRKWFHVLGLVMFVPATVIAPRFLSIGYAIGYAALLIIEIVKFGQVPPFAAWLTSAMNQFVDSRDEGHFTVTHLYLLVGCAAPLWVLSALGLDDDMLSRVPASYAGLLMLGVGDSAAAVVGTYYGRHKWFWPPNSTRSFEGSAAFVLSVLLSVFIGEFFLFHMGLTSVRVIGVTIAVVLTSALEAMTDQIDNIVLPLLFMGLLNVTLH